MTHRHGRIGGEIALAARCPWALRVVARLRRRRRQRLRRAHGAVRLRATNGDTQHGAARQPRLDEGARIVATRSTTTLRLRGRAPALCAERAWHSNEALRQLCRERVLPGTRELTRTYASSRRAAYVETALVKGHARLAVRAWPLDPPCRPGLERGGGQADQHWRRVLHQAGELIAASRVESGRHLRVVPRKFPLLIIWFIMSVASASSNAPCCSPARGRIVAVRQLLPGVSHGPPSSTPTKCRGSLLARILGLIYFGEKDEAATTPCSCDCDGAAASARECIRLSNIDRRGGKCIDRVSWCRRRKRELDRRMVPERRRTSPEASAARARWLFCTLRAGVA